MTSNELHLIGNVHSKRLVTHDDREQTALDRPAESVLRSDLEPVLKRIAIGRVVTTELKNMNLDEGQRKRVAAWIAEGLKLSEIQNRVASELGLQLTYMDVRLLVDDLKLVPKDAEPAKSTPVFPAPDNKPLSTQQPVSQDSPLAEPAESTPAGGLSLTVDQIARPGAVVSGKVSFSDGNKADWYIDQTGRLGLAPQQAGYRPSAADVQQFQMALESELSKLGL
jgi:hypothetical protein